MRITEKSLVFLKALDNLGGQASTPELKKETGFSANPVNYQYRKLEGDGLITVEKADEIEGGGSPPKIATLTESGVDALRRELETPSGEDEEKSPHLSPDEMVLRRSDFFEMKEANEELQRRVSSLEKKQSDIDDLDSIVEGLSDSVDRLLEESEDESGGFVFSSDESDELGESTDSDEDVSPDILRLERTLDMHENALGKKAPLSIVSEVAELDRSVTETMEKRYEYLEELNKRVISLSEWREVVNQHLMACEFAFNTINFDYDKALAHVSERDDSNGGVRASGGEN